MNAGFVKTDPELYKRSISSSYWVILTRLFAQLLTLLKSVIIAHYLLLSDLGLLAAAVLIIELFNTLSEGGFTHALIQKKGEIRHYLDTVWTVGIIRGAFLFTAIYFCAPLLASFKVSDDELQTGITIFRVMGLNFLIAGFSNTGTIYFQKDLRFQKTFIWSGLSIFVDVLFSVMLVFIFHSVWGVIAGRLVGACVNCAASHCLSDHRPKLCFNSGQIRELWKYGKWITGIQPLVYLINEGDDYFVWFYLGFPSLALYRYAYHFSDMPATQVANVISQVSFPAFSRIQDDIPRLREAYCKVLSMTAIFSLPMSLLIFLFGPDIVLLVLPERMHAVGYLLQILAFKGLLKALGSTQGPVYRAIGKPQIIMYLLWLRVSILALTIYPFTQKWGLAGTAWSTIMINAVADPISLWVLAKILKCSIAKLLRQIMLPLISCFAAGAGAITLRLFVISGIGFLQITVNVIVTLFIYIVVLLILDYLFPIGLRSIIFENINLLKSKFNKA